MESLSITSILYLQEFFDIFLPFSNFFFFFIAYLPSHNLGLTPPGNYKPNARGSDACRGNNSLWTKTLDRYTRAGLPECVVSTMSGPPPKTTQDRTQRYTPNPRTEIKIPDHAGNRTRAAGSTDHATATYSVIFLSIKLYWPFQMKKISRTCHAGTERIEAINNYPI